MTQFSVHSPETAPEGSKKLLEQAGSNYGFVPNLLGVLAEAPAALEAYTTLAGVFASTSLTPLEQQAVLISASVVNGCEYCVAAHTGMAKGAGASAEVLEGLRTGGSIPDPKLEALRNFTRSVVAHRGFVQTEDFQSFLAAGFTKAQVLEVITGVSMKTLSNYVNHIVETPLDRQFEAFRWSRGELAASA